MSGLQTPVAREGGSSRLPTGHTPREQPSAEGEHLSLIEPKRALFKISDGRYMVPVGMSTDASGAATLGLASSPDVDEADEEVVWVESHLESSSLHSQGINWIIRDFFGHAFEYGGARWTVTNTGAPNSAGVRVLELEKEGGVSSARSRKAHRRAQELLKDIKFDETRTGIFEANEFSGGQGAVVAYSPPHVQLAKLGKLKQVLQKLGVVPKKGKEVAASTATSLLEAALGTVIHSRVERESAAVRLNNKLELSAKRLKAIEAAVQRCEGEPMEPEQYGCLIRDHLVPSHTPASTPTGKEKRGSKRTITDSGREGDSESSSESDTESSEDEEPRPKRRSAMRHASQSRKRHRPEESEGDTDLEDKECRQPRTVRLDPRTELRAITPRGVEPLQAAAILLKEAGVREAASFTVPEDWQDAVSGRPTRGGPEGPSAG